MVIKDANLDGSKMASTLEPAQMVQMANYLRNFILSPCGKKGWKEAQVTKGGIKTNEVSSVTMMSKKATSLFICGEILDIHGDCGGYNLHLAFTTGRIAGNNAGKFLK